VRASRAALLGSALAAAAIAVAAVLGAGPVAAASAAASAATAAPHCYGAAAHDPSNPCPNPVLSAYPAEGSVASFPYTTDCKLVHEQPGPVCTFGVSAAQAKAHIALIGDSHALHWRAALEDAAHTMHWRGYSITTAGCIFSAASRYLPAGFRADCDPWYRAATAWFRQHPEVSTVFVSQFAPTPVVPPAGESYGVTKVTGFQRTWRALPKTVKHIIVIRDTPATTDAARACVRTVLAAGTQAPGPACETPRSVALRWDTAVTAATDLHSPRYGSVDLTDFFCDRSNCEPVIGGVRVYNDDDHITAVYSRTLAPYLVRKVRALMTTW
jgi:hypothetical protein